MNKAVLGTLALIVSVAVPQRADACSTDASTPRPTCRKADVLLQEGARVPTGAPGIAFRPLESTDFELRDATGQVVPTTRDKDETGADLLKPQAPLTADSEYNLTYKDVCTNTTQTFTFRTAAAAPWPAASGQVTQQSKLSDEPLPDSCGAESERKPAASVTLTLTPSAELLPWLPLMEVTASIGAAGYGEGTNIGGAVLQDGNLATFTAFCDDTVPIAPTLQNVTIRARIPGAPTQPADQIIPVDLRCHPPDQDGCALTHSPDGAWPLALLALTALLRRRRPSV